MYSIYNTDSKVIQQKETTKFPIGKGDPRLELLHLDVTGFNVQDFLPDGYELTTAIGKSKSLESFWNHFVTTEWAQKGFVAKGTKFPYDMYKLALFLEVSLGIVLLQNGQFIQINKWGQISLASGLSKKLERTFTFLNSFGQRYYSLNLVRIFDNSLWFGKEIQKNPQFIKRITFSDEQWQSYFSPQDLDMGEITTHSIGYENLHYKIMRNRYTFADWQPPQDIAQTVYDLISVALSTNQFILNKDIVSQLRKVLPETGMTDVAVLKVFDRMATEMNITSTQHRTKHGRGRKVYKTKLTLQKESSVVHSSSVVDAI